MNFAQKQSELLAQANEVKNFEEENVELSEKKESITYSAESEKKKYEELVREALFEKLYGGNHTRVNKLIAVLLATENRAYVALAKQLESLLSSRFHEQLKHIDSMMIARTRLEKSYGYTPDRKTILTTYKEYKEAKQKSSKYNIEFFKKAKKCGCAKKIFDRATSIIFDLEAAIPSLAQSYAWKNDEHFSKFSVEQTLREHMDAIEDFLGTSPLIKDYLQSKESRIELKR